MKSGGRLISLAGYSIKAVEDFIGFSVLILFKVIGLLFCIMFNVLELSIL